MFRKRRDAEGLDSICSHLEKLIMKQCVKSDEWRRTKPEALICPCFCPLRSNQQAPRDTRLYKPSHYSRHTPHFITSLITNICQPLACRLPTVFNLERALKQISVIIVDRTVVTTEQFSKEEDELRFLKTLQCLYWIRVTNVYQVLRGSRRRQWEGYTRTARQRLTLS